MTQQFRLAILLAFATLVSSCGPMLAPIACTLEARPAIFVDIKDSISGAAVLSGARAIATDGSYADTATADVTMIPYSLAFERPGTYTLTVEQSGYQPWARHGITVTRDDCHVRTASVIALLRK